MLSRATRRRASSDRRIGWLLAFCLGGGVAPAAAQKAKDTTEVDPDGHRVVLENTYVRVVEARLAPGQKVAMHSHTPRVVVALSPFRLKLTLPDGRSGVVDRRVGEASWSEATEHAAQALVGTVHAVEVEPKARPPAVGLKARDETEVAPDVARVVFENEKVRVVEGRAATGQKVPLHSHPPRVGIILSPARIKHTDPEGRSEVIDLRSGEARWSEAVEHSSEVLVGPLHYILVEIKAARAAP